MKSDSHNFYVYKDTQENGEAKYTFITNKDEVPAHAAERVDCEKGNMPAEIEVEALDEYSNTISVSWSQNGIILNNIPEDIKIRIYHIPKESDLYSVYDGILLNGDKFLTNDANFLKFAENQGVTTEQVNGVTKYYFKWFRLKIEVKSQDGKIDIFDFIGRHTNECYQVKNYDSNISSGNLNI